MATGLRLKIARWLASDYITSLEKKAQDAELNANRRVVDTLARLDPFEPLLKKYNSVFGEDYEKPEEKLDARGQLGLKLWAYTVYDDPYFQFLLQWLLNTQGNAAINKGNPTPETILWSRALISNLLLFKREVGRLAALYKELLVEKDGPDAELTVE